MNLSFDQYSKTTISKSSEFDNLFDINNENLLGVETKIENLNKNLIGLDNIYLIDEQVNTCGDIQNDLLQAAQNIEELKELSEKLIDNYETDDDRERIEKRLESIINKWNSLSRQIDDKYNGLKYLNVHLKQLKLN